MTIKVKKVRPTAVIPTHGSSFSAGYDLYADLPEALGFLPAAALQPGKACVRPTVSVCAIRITAATIWSRCTMTRRNPGR